MDLPIPEILSNMAGVAVVMYFMNQRLSDLLKALDTMRANEKYYRDRYEALLRELANVPDPESITQHRIRVPADIDAAEYQRTHQAGD